MTSGLGPMPPLSIQPCVVWLTGLSASGKSTLATELQRELRQLGAPCYLLDGDAVRSGLSKDLGYSDRDRQEHMRRVGEIARLFVDAGLIAIVALISPFRAERRAARDLFKHGEFIEVFVDTPLSVCEQRDPKGLYRRARAGDIPLFTGIDSPYEPPESPEIRLEAGSSSVASCVAQLLSLLHDGGKLGPRVGP